MLDGIRTTSREDAAYIKLLNCVTRSFPITYDGLDPAQMPYWKERDHLYHDGDLVLLNPRIVVSSALRCDVLARLHDSHRSMEATKRRARRSA